MIIERKISKIIESHLFKGRNKKKVIIIYGPRQVGKTTLVQQLLKKHPGKAEYFNCDYFDVQEQFAYKNAGQFQKFLSNVKLLILDEAQRIENIGLVLKILVDHYPSVQVVATGSSSFDLSNKIKEPLTGRKIELKLFPFSVSELFVHKTKLEKNRLLENFLRYGTYPAAILADEKGAELALKELTSSYLFKDVLAFQDLKRSDLLIKLLQLLAFQIGHQVSYHELAINLGVDQTVIQKYIHLLEEAFVLFRLPAFSRNLRKEVAKSRKIYFYDLGIRNTLIQNYNPLSLRKDAGELWENFCIAERIKALEYDEKTANHYFWRTYTQKEIDFIEEKGGQLAAYEFKWDAHRTVKPPKEFLETYKGSTFQVITPENYEKFLEG
ncbi:MAG: hypothetical protein UT36_C0001G0111 [Candidatus Peregrinibacteria bacterium GW2011_GWF2_39_17]|nr:MAG: hypothetical protein UT36_C0001G0111 [Candidatus Peregrinibacteria bacterium GW2011_GWF2_39_17]HCW32547.1 ATPase [Candidatus Peregrinibacteria bacterium]